METIHNQSNFMDYIKGATISSRNMIFRGVKECDYLLIPAIGRLKTNENKAVTVNDEKLMLKLFRQKAYPYIKDYLGSNLDLLSIAQHNGLPTRLLDWTKNPLVAFYFAVCDDFKIGEQLKDAAIYQYTLRANTNIESDFDPFTITKTRRHVPRHLSPRITAQSGLFTVHPMPHKEFETADIVKVIIKNAARKGIKKALNRMGINHATLFPDLGGICSHIKYLRTNSF